MRKHCLVFAALLGVAHVPAYAAPDWRWASKLPEHVAKPLRSDLGAEDYTPEERRNIETALRMLKSDPDAALPPELATARLHRIGMADLARIAGFEPVIGSGYDAASVPDRKNIVQNIVAKDNRLAILWKWEGHHRGDFFGVKGTGKRIASQEFAVLTFDEAGKVTEASFHSDEIDIAWQVGVPMHIGPETAAEYPVPPLALDANNPPYATETPLPDVLASLRSEAWPPVWPPAVSDPNLRSRLEGTPYSKEEQTNVKAMIRFGNLGFNDFNDYEYDHFGESYNLLRNGMHDISRFAREVCQPGYGFITGYSLKTTPDRVTRVEDMIVKGNKVWLAWRWYATHSGGTWYRAAPSGKRVVMHETGFYELRNGIIVAGEMHGDELELARQVGFPITLPASYDRSCVISYQIEQ